VCRYTTLWNIRWCTQASNTTDQLHDQRWSSLACGPKQLALKSDRLCCLECSLTVNQLKQAIVAEWGKLSQRVVNCAIGQWRRRLVCVVQQQGGHIMTLDNNWNNKHVSVVNFLKWVVAEAALFLIVILKTMTFHRVVAHPVCCVVCWWQILYANDVYKCYKNLWNVAFSHTCF